jgi:glyoxylase-like metal-dependent hydrolase (beta-lactamase superfamily II)
MIEEVLTNLYRIEVPVPQNPLRAVNCYLVKAPGQFLLIDTGMNRRECVDELHAGLKNLGVDLNKTNFFITHWHADHLGMVSTLASDKSAIYFNEPEATGVNFPMRDVNLQKNIALARLSDFPEDELERVTSSHPGYRYSVKGNVAFSIVQDGDTLTIGDYSFQCIKTAGHSPGHLCLYEPNRRVLVSGDHLLIDITPNIAIWSNMGNPLRDYLASLDRVYALDIDLVLPGHRALFTNCRERIQQLKEHHEARANEIISILEKGGQVAYQIATQMHWDIGYKSWHQFPPLQKWFAAGEAIAHLKYLEEREMIHSEISRHKMVFSLNG